MQGQLRGRTLSFVIESRCAHSGRSLRIEIDSDLNVQRVAAGADPFIFVPGIDLGNIKQESIIDIF